MIVVLSRRGTVAALHRHYNSCRMSLATSLMQQYDMLTRHLQRPEHEKYSVEYELNSKPFQLFKLLSLWHALCNEDI